MTLQVITSLPEKWVLHTDSSAVPQRALMGATCTADYYEADYGFLWKQFSI